MSIQSTLIKNLWLPSVQSFSAFACPRKKQDFGLKLFTLSDGLSFEFESKIHDEGFAMKSDAIAWTLMNPSKKFRTESEGFYEVIDDNIYDGNFLSNKCLLIPYYPLDIFNFDFTRFEIRKLIDYPGSCRLLRKAYQLKAKRGV